MPIYLTQAATAQGYFPEWLVSGTVLTDSTVMGRQYDQRQWAHAFGLSVLPGQERQSRTSKLATDCTAGTSAGRPRPPARRSSSTRT